MPIFSKTIIDKAKRFSPMKTTFQDEQLGRFSLHSESQKLSKSWNENYHDPESVKIVNSQFSYCFRSAKRKKSGSGVETNCYKHKKIQ